MKRIFIFLILISTLYFSAFAQINQTLPCPTVSVLGPAGIPNPNEVVTFTAAIGQGAEKFDLLLNWKVDNGEIVNGQGTKQIKVFGGNFCNKDVIAKLEIKGLPKNCQNNYSETLSIACCFLNPIQIDEFSISANQIDKTKLNNLVIELQKSPSAQIYIIERFEKKTLPKTIERKKQKTIDYLKETGMDSSRFTFINGYSDKNLTQIFLVPSGATPPTCDDDDCEDIKLK